jgi:hypothetical protein
MSVDFGYKYLKDGMESSGECKLCSASLDTLGFFYNCTTCSETLCELCFFEEGHEHKMDQHRAALPDRSLFFYEDPITQKRLYLGNFVGATPGSETLRQHDIRFILTLIDFADEVESHAANQEMDALRAVYSGGKVNAEERSIRYHLIPMPDVLSPERLPAALKSVLEEATCFIDAGLQQGSVLVHCQRGEKRSPTIFLAWMLTRGIKISDAIEMLDKGYTGKTGWGNVYKRTRKDWIEELKRWSRSWKERQLAWSQSVSVVKE